MQNLLNEVLKALKSDERLLIDGKLAKNKIVELALAMDEGLITLLLKNKAIKKHFFTKAGEVLVFDKVAFQSFVSNKQFLPDSYTAFKNKIGLTANKEYLTESKEVVLAWPYKDCVLEGGQTKEDQKRDEIFWNETLAPDEIDRLLEPKVLTNFKKYDSDGEHKVKSISTNDNLIIKGNNLLALHSIEKKYLGKVKLICIDPPYNKGGDDFNYNDSFNHSTWLTFMKSRLNCAKSLLHSDGTIYIFCDDNESAYLKVLCDEIFDRKSFVSSIIWRNSDNSNNDAKQFSQDHNYILVYSRNEAWESINLPRTEEQSSHYKNPDNDPRGAWFDGNPLNSPNPRKNLKYNLTAPNGNIVKHPPNGWRWDKKTMQEKMKTGEIRFNKENTNIKRRTYLEEQKGLPPSTLWEVQENNFWLDLAETGHTRQAKAEQKKLFPKYPTSDLFKTPKPEKVIQKIINISTKQGDYVLDFFGGSGTTGAVAHKMGRKFILIEQMDYINTFTTPRLAQVVSGEQGGISKTENWTGGGSFIYCELTEHNATIIDKIEKAKTNKALKSIWEEIQNSDFISHKIKPESINKNIKEFETLSLNEQKQFLLSILDKNQLYVNYSDIDDKDFKVSEEDKALNKQFYGEA